MSELYNLEDFNNLGEVSFIDNITPEQLISESVSDYETEYERITGIKETLYPADPMRILINVFALKLYQAHMFIDKAGQRDMLAKADGEFLEHLVALRGVTRNEAKAASVVERFHASAIRDATIPIPIGTCVSAGDNIFFATVDYGEIKPGESFVDVIVVALQSGTNGNNYEAKQLNVLNNPLPFVEIVENITVTSGGVDIESDDSLRQRGFIAPDGYSVAGPDGAYIFWVRTYSQIIENVNVYGPPEEPGVVDVRVVLAGGKMPDESFLAGLYDFICNKNIRPLTDKVRVAAPDVVSYDIKLKYYVNRSRIQQMDAIQKNIKSAVTTFVDWQRKIGRDINPSYLTKLLMDAGAKRVEIISPFFIVLNEIEIGMVGEVTVEYGGLEND